MQSKQVVSNAVLKDALQAVVHLPMLPDKLAWWLLQGNSIERWFQFELAFQMNCLLQKSHIVLCEQQWKDIVVIKQPPEFQPLSKNKAEVAIELKMFGNWHVTDHQSRVLSEDVVKVDRYALEEKISSMALVIWVIATPKDTSVNYGWLMKQVRDGLGVADINGIQERMKERMKESHLNFEQVCEPINASNDLFENLQIHAYAYRKEPVT